ncbi:MAG: phosphoribosylamine--glycine ligase [Candidatus Latescibacteria bacterium 4484_7]|nr:MAG: phosphoribosylamine--glycine ligase [Candidatus Latescibacteria bacterium 4484_7]
MKVLVVGGGGREHAIAWKLSQSTLVDKIYAAPGNGGICRIAECFDISGSDKKSLLKLVGEKSIDLVVVGPEAPLVDGIVDDFSEEGVKVFGFRKDAARLEGSKVWAKEFMKRHSVPTGQFDVFSEPDRAVDALDAYSPPYVIKADGLAAGKGVIIADNRDDAEKAISRMMREKAYGSAGERVVVEEYLSGEEVSVLAVFDGRDYRLFVPSQDHKRAFDGDKGPNTGGMGAYAPVPFVDEKAMESIVTKIVEPTFNGMISEGISGAGVLYFGLILTSDGPKVLEYNCRFGDPETQVVLPLLETDIAEVFMAAIEGGLKGVDFSNSSDSAVCVVVASGGYPGSYKKGFEISGLDEAEEAGVIVFHAGTKLQNGKYVTAGGRVLGVTALSGELKDAVDKAYRGVELVEFGDAFYRRDIAAKAFGQVK